MNAPLVGQPLRRVEARAKVTGATRDASDRLPHGCAHAALVTATIAKGRIAAIDTAAARRVPRVLHVMTHEKRRPAIHIPKVKGEDTDQVHGDPETELAASACNVDALYTTPAEHHAVMEQHAKVAEWEGDSLAMHCIRSAIPAGHPCDHEDSTGDPCPTGSVLFEAQ